MKSFIKKTSWFSRIILLLLFINFCFCQFKVYQSIYYHLPDFVTAIYGIKSSIALGVLLVYGLIQSIGFNTQNKDDVEDNFYSEFLPSQQDLLKKRDELASKSNDLNYFIYRKNSSFKNLPISKQLDLRNKLDATIDEIDRLNELIKAFYDG